MESSTHRLLNFYKQFFQITNCTIEAETNETLTVQLTCEIDKAIMNRPYYWSYVETMKIEGKPQKIILHMKHNNEKNTICAYYDTPIYKNVTNWIALHSAFGVYYEKVYTNKKTKLFPWLILNVKMTYKGKLYKDEILSIGLQLVHGSIAYNIMEQLHSIPLSTQISNYCFTITPIISLKSGYNRLEKLLDEHLEQHSYEWAMEMEHRRNHLQKMYAEIYGSVKNSNNTDTYAKPEINIEIINGAIVYLA